MYSIIGPAIVIYVRPIILRVYHTKMRPSTAIFLKASASFY